MIKNTNYFRNFDLSAAAGAIKKLGVERGKSEIFGDAINAFFILSEERVVRASELTDVLGPPDKLIEREVDEIWEYNWTGKHGPNSYTSTTPFLIVDGILKRVVRDAEDDD